MSYTSIGFFLFVALLTAIYYIPFLRKYRWIVLLAGSLFFYCYASFKCIVYLCFTIIVSFFSTNVMHGMTLKQKKTLKDNKGKWEKEKVKEYKHKTEHIRKTVCIVTLILNFGILIVVKYFNFTVNNISALLNMPSLSENTRRLMLPLGISFYTFQIMGYVIDVYRETIEPEKNIAKLALFTMFFPQIIQGPIGSWSELSNQLFAPHDFQYEDFRNGLELIIWGMLKKMVIADRAAIVITAVRETWVSYDGAVLTATVLLYTLQLYADFSGGIDISRGVASLFGITMAENFKRPYFASSINEFWRRWHITLGSWMKNYLFYPLALSEHALRFIEKHGRTAKTEYSRHVVKVLPSCAATMIVFIIVGLWHGVGSQYLAFGLYNGILISAAMLMEPLFIWQNKILGVNTDSLWIRFFRILRTFVLVSIGNITDLTKSFTQSIQWFSRMISAFCLPEIIKLKTVSSLALRDYIVLLLGTLLLFVVSVRQEKKPEKTVRQDINALPLPVRWIVLLTGILCILLFGIYGPGYDASSFIYMQF